MKFTTPLALAAATLVATSAFADNHEAAEEATSEQAEAERGPDKVFTQDSVAAMEGDIVIENPYAVAISDQVLVFMTIHNGADAADVLKSVSSEAASTATIAEYQGTGDERKTAKLDELPTPGNNAVMLDQDGYHFVLSDLKQELEGGDTIPLVLKFEETGDLEVEVSVAVMN